MFPVSMQKDVGMENGKSHKHGHPHSPAHSHASHDSHGSHDHEDDPLEAARQTRRKLIIATIFASAFMGVEIVGGVLAGKNNL